MNDIIEHLPEMLSGQELVDALTLLPKYDDNIRNANPSMRLISLSDIYNIYLPSEMSVEIYNKLYLALLRSLNKKYTKIATRQQNENYKSLHQQEYESIIGGSDSFTIIGLSGIGKSSAISRAVSLMTDSPIIEISNPYTKIIPCITIQCPWDSSVKGMLLEILRKVDELLDSKYYINAIRSRATTDMLIGSVSQVALNHIGMIIIDEIQNVCNSRYGKNLISVLTQLINNSGISIAMVGTPESSIFFQQALQLARRSIGLEYTALPYDTYFKTLCNKLFQYQYTTNVCTINDGITEWFYEHSRGVTSAVIAMFHDAQEIAIMKNKSAINIDILNETYTNRMKMLHGYLQSRQRKAQPVITTETFANAFIVNNIEAVENSQFITTAMLQATNCHQDIITLLKKSVTVEEIEI